MNSLELIEAVRSEDIETVRELLDSGADVDSEDDYGWSPLCWAAGKGNVEIIKLLLGRGAKISKTGNDGRTPYQIALAAVRVDAVKVLREAESQAKNGSFQGSEQERVYCKAYYLRDVSAFEGWQKRKVNGESETEEFQCEDIVFLHQDFTVTQSIWHNENTLFDQVTPEWKAFCEEILKFKVPDDFDLMMEAVSTSEHQ